MKRDRLLDELRRAGEPVAVADLGRRLTASPAPLPGGLARRLVASALAWPEAELPDPIDPELLRPPGERAVARIPLEEASFVVVDLETTGLSPERCEIIEIAAVHLRALEPVAEFASFVRPTGEIPPRIVDLTGIDGPIVASSPPLAEVLATFRAWYPRSPEAPFVAHNAGFDSRFVWAGLAASGLPALAAPILCTRQLSRRLVPEIGRYGLDALCAHFGYSNPARHRATGDARVTARVLVDLLSRARDDGMATLGELIDLQARRPSARRRPRSGRRPGPASGPGSVPDPVPSAPR